MSLLPNFENAVIPMEKLTKYALNPERNSDKALAFKVALGYTEASASWLMRSIRQNLGLFETICKGSNGHGERFQCIMAIVGPNMKSANVLTGWIMEDGTDFPRLTSIYVTKKKARRLA